MAETLKLTPTESVTIRQSSPEMLAVEMWNPGDQPARVIWQTRPALRTEGWFRSIDALHREGRVGGNGTPGPLALGALLSEYDDVFRLAGPRVLVKGAVAVLGVLGRARGYKPNPETFGASVHE